MFVQVFYVLGLCKFSILYVCASGLGYMLVLVVDTIYFYEWSILNVCDDDLC